MITDDQIISAPNVRIVKTDADLDALLGVESDTPDYEANLQAANAAAAQHREGVLTGHVVGNQFICQGMEDTVKGVWSHNFRIFAGNICKSLVRDRRLWGSWILYPIGPSTYRMIQTKIQGKLKATIANV